MRLALDIIISAVFAVSVASLVGLAALLMCFFVFFRDSESPAVGLIGFAIAGFCAFVSGVFAFPLCGIWLDQRRRRRKLQLSTETE
jgi:predicted exporter